MTMKNATISALASAILCLSTMSALAGAIAEPTPVPDVSGVWQGTVSCKSLTTQGLTAKAPTLDVEVVMVQTNTNYISFYEESLVLDTGRGPIEPPEASGCGMLVSKKGNEKKGSIVVSPLDPNNVLLPSTGFFWRDGATFSVTSFPEKNGVSGKLKGKSQESRKFLGTSQCTWKLQRTSTSTDGFSSSPCNPFN